MRSGYVFIETLLESQSWWSFLVPSSIFWKADHKKKSQVRIGVTHHNSCEKKRNVVRRRETLWEEEVVRRKKRSIHWYICHSYTSCPAGNNFESTFCSYFIVTTVVGRRRYSGRMRVDESQSEKVSNQECRQVSRKGISDERRWSFPASSEPFEKIHLPFLVLTIEPVHL